MTAMMKFTAMIKVVELLHRDFAISDGSMHCCFHRKRSLMYLSSSYIKPGYSVVDAVGAPSKMASLTNSTDLIASIGNWVGKHADALQDFGAEGLPCWRS